jgi:AcrR family transcriptional regulator
MSSTETRGRPRLREDAEILDAALGAFAAVGYDAMSLRSLNAELGLSHGAINARFGSKQDLYYAALHHGFVGFFADIAAERARRPQGLDDLGELREAIRAFLVAASRRPELGRLMNQEGLHATDRLDHFVHHVFLPGVAPTLALLGRLAERGEIHPVSARAVFFLVAHGAEAPYTLTALSAAFDDIDGPLDPLTHAELVTDLIMRGLRRYPG